MAASHHGDTPYSGKTVTSVPVTPYTTSVDVNLTKTLRYHGAILTFCGVYTTRPADEEGENCSS